MIHLLRWGLVPSWAKNEAIATTLIDTPGELIAEKQSFRPAFPCRRCIVAAYGICEWHQITGGNQPFYRQPGKGDFFGSVGL